MAAPGPVAWTYCGARLRAGYRVGAVDLPGHGRCRDERFDLERSIDELDGLAESPRGSRRAVVGHSIGGIHRDGLRRAAGPRRWPRQRR
jgi:pimeloyl-ACP methyl ester carboxylesterase